MRIVRNIWPWVVLFCAALAYGDSEVYVVRLNRPAAGGEAYRLEAECVSSRRVRRRLAGRMIEGQRDETRIQLTADVLVLDVTGDGFVSRFRLTIQRFVTSQNGNERQLLPADSIITGSVTNASFGFELDGKPLASDMHSRLCDVFQLAKGARCSTDEVFECDRPQPPGARWNISEPTARRVLLAPPQRVGFAKCSGSATLVEVGKTNAQAWMKVGGELVIEGLTLPLPRELQVQCAPAVLTYSATFPVEGTKGPMERREQLSAVCSMNGLAQLGVGMEISTERIVTARMSY